MPDQHNLVSHPISRRAALAAGLAAGAAATLPRRAAALPPAAANAPSRVLRFSHPTDIHIQPELGGGEGTAACFRHMLALPDPPAMVITGGDLPMDTASTPEARSKVEWDLFNKVLADTLPASMPVYHTIGNHDVFGRDKKKSKTTGQEAHYGRKWFLDNFHYDRTYRSFDKAGWHFVILDSIDLNGEGPDFHARIAGEQLDWLKEDLQKTPASIPTVVISHVPIISVANYFDRDDSEWSTDGPTLEIKSSRMHVDCRDLDALFQKHPNIKLCLSGHLHLLDTCVYNGITHICDGAVSGAKWKGPKRQTPEGYGVIDLFNDGTFKHEYVTFGWNAASYRA
jgi:3',5'-cyclic AMP phosphodiesterase CpdA